MKMTLMKALPSLLKTSHESLLRCQSNLATYITSGLFMHKKILNDGCNEVNHKNKYRKIRLFRESSTSNETSVTNKKQIYNTDSLLETWFYTVCPWGSIKVNVPFNIVIKPLPPHEYPEMDKVIIQLHYDKNIGKVPDSYKLSEISDIYEYRLSFDEDKANMNLNVDLPPGVTLPIICHLQVPINFDLDIKTVDNGNVSIEKMESKTINLETDKGNCFLKSIKCGSATATSKSGDIVSKSTLLGNLSLHTGQSGSIQAAKLQGSTINCQTEMGRVDVKSIYCGTTSVITNGGDVNLGNTHGHLSMKALKSNLKVESLEGDLDISLQSGNIAVHFSANKEANIEMSDGDISLSFTEGAATDLNLRCNNVVVDNNINLQHLKTTQPNHVKGFIGKSGESQVNVNLLSGSINIKQLDWIQTTKLAMLINTEKLKT